MQKNINTPARVLFYRRLIGRAAGTNGGNLKLKDCFNHLSESQQFQPYVYFSADTVWNEHPGNYWRELRSQQLPQWEIDAGDVLFFSGKDWEVLNEEEQKKPPVPIVNIVQPRHSFPDDPRRVFLQYPAIRIAKSEHGAAILREYGVNGPLFVIPDAIDLSLLPDIPDHKDIDILIPGLKEPQLAQAVYDRLQAWNQAGQHGLNIFLQLPPKLPTRSAFLDMVSRAKLVACIPLSIERGAEGFYLPALEAMALKALVVCPHAIGNLNHCLDGVNCLVPAYDADHIAERVQEAWLMDKEQQQRMLAAGWQTAYAHRIENEQKAVVELVENAYDLWQQATLFNSSF